MEVPMPNPVGRPKNEYTPAQEQEISDLAFDGCQCLTIARLTGIPEANLRHHFGELIKKKHAERKHMLRKAQFEDAMGDKPTTMLIWLGKQELGQADKSDQNVTATMKMYGQEANVDEV
jgi:hypothetical protein